MSPRIDHVSGRDGESISKTDQPNSLFVVWFCLRLIRKWNKKDVVIQNIIGIHFSKLSYILNPNEVVKYILTEIINGKQHTDLTQSRLRPENTFNLINIRLISNWTFKRQVYNLFVYFTGDCSKFDYAIRIGNHTPFSNLCCCNHSLAT